MIIVVLSHWASFLHFCCKKADDNDYTQHYAAAENGSTSANGSKYLSKMGKKRSKIGFFAHGSVSREPPIKAGDKSLLSSATRKFKPKICFLSTKKKDGVVLSLI